MTPEETIQVYCTQAIRRVAWSALATTIALMTALAFKFGTDFTYPAWLIGILVWGVIFLPWFFIKGSGKNTTSTKDAVKAYREIKRQRRA